jgi:hypothetical protein
VSRDAVLQLLASERVDVVSRLLACVRRHHLESATFEEGDGLIWTSYCSNRLRPEGSDSQQLQREPAVFLPTKYAFPHILTETTGRETLPTFVVLFSNTATRVERLLARAEYEKVPFRFLKLYSMLSVTDRRCCMGVDLGRILSPQPSERRRGRSRGVA